MSDNGQIIAAAYRRKITPSEGHIRKVDEKTLLMRIGGRISEGWEETGAYGEYVRWVGEFCAIVPDDEGVIKAQLVSRNMILPNVGADWLLEHMKAENVDTKVKLRTGVHWIVNGPEDVTMSDVEFIIDLFLVPPSRASERGYEFYVEVVRADPRHNPIAKLVASVAGSGLTALAAPAVVAPGTEVAKGKHREKQAA